jgi:hypothetical protein
VQRAGIAALRLGYRHPNDLDACVHDVLAACDFLHHEGVDRVVLLDPASGRMKSQPGRAIGRATHCLLTGTASTPLHVWFTSQISPPSQHTPEDGAPTIWHSVLAENG